MEHFITAKWDRLRTSRFKSCCSPQYLRTHGGIFQIAIDVTDRFTITLRSMVVLLK